ncbi:restriction endonuclease subunit S [uncultured Selenomonas sp.]|uniref:restriction endonuclease subunit S n=1 Tax=uncultured Selenomonas sp. TaxID=159275 RepID=UPI0026770319|nr:restriction endonuclease subunit S [uncultured Selenomonas sp.]
MSKLSEMLKELCPDGVEYKKLGEIAHYAKDRIKISDIDARNYVGVEHLRQNTEGREMSVTLPEVDFVISFYPEDILIGNIRPYLKKAWLADCNGGTNGDVLTIRIVDKMYVSPQYLFYILSSEQFFMYDMKYAKGAKMPRGDKKAVMNYAIPVPPLAIQNEIVKLLDNFTELTAELQLRKKQYSFYRDSLLNFSPDDVDDTASSVAETPHYMVGDIFNIQNGYTPSKKEDTYWENGTIPWYRLEDIRTQGRILYDAIQHVHSSGVKGNLYPTKSLLMSTTATIGEYALLMTPSLSNQQMTNFAIKKEFEDVLDVKFAFYYFHVFAEWCKKNANQSGGMPIITTGKLKIFFLPHPTARNAGKNRLHPRPLRYALP